jgi:hypothetical protein
MCGVVERSADYIRQYPTVIAHKNAAPLYKTAVFTSTIITLLYSYIISQLFTS